MTETYQPTRLEVVEQLPRNAMGKVNKHHLRTWLGGARRVADPRRVRVRPTE